MKVLLTGCRGQLGLELSRALEYSTKDYEIIKTDIHNLDITCQTDVFRIMQLEKPHMVINCAAYTNVDRCETDELNAFRVNAIGAQNLAAGAYNADARIIQISTDYVFDGTGNAAKKEYDSTNPINCYGRSKMLGEILVREINPRHYIIRTAWLYGEGRNFIRTMIRMASENEIINVVDDQIGTPTSAQQLTKCILNLMNTESYGTYHATCEGSCSWYEFACRIFELKNIDACVNRITSKQLNRPAQRPGNSVLDNYMLKLLGMNTFSC